MIFTSNMNKHNEIIQTISLIKDDFSLKTNSIIKEFFNVFILLDFESLSNESYIEYDKTADYIKIQLISKDGKRMNFSFEFFHGLTEIFIDNDIELIIQYKFEDSKSANIYFNNCLASTVHVDYLKNKNNSVICYNYKFILNECICIETGSSSFFRRLITKTKIVNQIFCPWIKPSAPLDLQSCGILQKIS